MSEAPTETVILCEGHHDRDFWAGLLLHLGCTDPGITSDRTGRVPVLDPWKERVVKGHFAYRSRGGAFLRVVPCGGVTKVQREARARLDKRGVKAVRRLVLNVDPDVDVSDSSSRRTGLMLRDVLRLAMELDPAAKQNGLEMDLDGGATKVSLVRWEVAEAVAPGVPNHQTLERLVCSALAAAYPGRAVAVHSWLEARPEPPLSSPKEHAWSYMAGWYADSGCEAFYSNLWQVPELATRLQARLQASGAWPIIEAIAS